MSGTASYYRQVREILWPILKSRVSRKESLREQMQSIVANEQRAAKKLLRLPSSGVPAPLVRHAEAWGKHLQGYQAIIDSADAVGLLDWVAEPEGELEPKAEPGVIRTMVGTFITVFAQEAFGVGLKSSETKPVKGVSAAAMTAHQKRAKKYDDERTRLESLLLRAGVDHVPDFRPRNYALLWRWSETEELHPRQSIIGPSDAEIEEQLKLLPGGDQLSVIELYPCSDEYLSMCGATDEGFAFRYDEEAYETAMESVKEDFSLTAAMELIREFLSSPDEWESLTEWRERT